MKNYLKPLSQFDNLGQTDIRLSKVDELICSLLIDIRKVKGHGHKKFVRKLLNMPQRTFCSLISGSSPIKIMTVEQILTIWKMVCNKSKKDYDKIFDLFFYQTNYFSIARGKKAKLPKKATPEFAYLLGFTMGDGCLVDINKTLKRRGAIYPVKLASDTRKFAEEILNPLFKKIFDIDGHIYNIKGNKCKEFSFSSKVVYVFLHNICEMPLGEKKGKLRVPKIIKNSSDEVKMNFIAGFLDSDGYVYVKRKDVAVTQGDKRFLEEMKELIENLGFKTRKIYTQHKEWGTTYSLSLSWKSVHDFAKATPSRHFEKSRKLKEVEKMCILEYNND